jgi:hypothetical protein
MKDLPYGSTYCVDEDGTPFIISSDGQFSFADQSFEKTAISILGEKHFELSEGGRPAIMLQDGRYLLNLEGRYTVAKAAYNQEWEDFGIASLEFGDYSDLVSSLYSGETTKEWWDKMSAENEVVSLRFVVDSLALGKELSAAEIAVLNHHKATRYAIQQLQRFRVHAPYRWNGRDGECFWGGSTANPNNQAVYSYIRMAAADGMVEVLQKLMCAPYRMEGLLFEDYSFEGDRMLGDFVQHAIEAGHDIEKMFIKACKLDVFSASRSRVYQQFVSFLD